MCAIFLNLHTGSESEESLQEMQTEESHEQETQTPGDNLIVLLDVCIVMFRYSMFNAHKR